MKTTACAFILIFVISGCNRNDKEQIASLTIKVSQLETQLSDLQKQKELLETQLSDLKKRNEAQELTIREQAGQLEKVKQALTQIIQATSDATSALQDFYLVFRQPASQAEFDAQAAPLLQKLKKIQQGMPRDLRARQIIAETLAAMNHYQGVMQAADLFIASRKALGAIEALVDSSRAPSEQEHPQGYGRDIEKQEGDIARETVEFRQKIQISISLLEDQLTIMRQGT